MGSNIVQVAGAMVKNGNINNLNFLPLLGVLLIFIVEVMVVKSSYEHVVNKILNLNNVKKEISYYDAISLILLFQTLFS